jgi:NADH-quinone oxidoreductase subunit J
MFPALDPFLANTVFGGLAVVALACAVGVVVARHPLNAAICLVGAMLSLAGIYSLLDSPFLAVLQVLVYAGAVMMLVVFVIMVLNRARETTLPRFDPWSLVTALPAVLLTLLLCNVLRGQGLANAAEPVRGEPQPLAARLFDLTPGGPGYYLLFIAVGVVLLAAVVGAVLLAKRRLDAPEAEPVQEAGDGHAH